jgi:glycine/D-amino acid oxidase-like deaminating enzyme
VITDRGHLRADRIVVAAGPLTARLVPGVRLRRMPARLARLSVRLPSMLHLVETGFYARPDGSGGAVAGDGSIAAIRRDAARVFGTGAACVGAGGGFVVATHDGRPLLERVDETTFVLTGMGGDGLALAPAMGERVARLLGDAPEDHHAGT